MHSISWRKLLYITTIVLFSLAIVFWVFTIIGWFITEPGFEPLNVLVGAIISSLSGILTLLKAHKTQDTPITNTLLKYVATSKQYERYRQTVLKRVEDFWIKGLLEYSLHGAILIDIDMQECKDAIEHPWDAVLRTPDKNDRILPRGTRIIDVFNQMGQALLILGEPGSGKTTMLLELARSLIDQALQDSNHSIPLVFNLSTWKEAQKAKRKLVSFSSGGTVPLIQIFPTIEEKPPDLKPWIIEELSDKYNIPPRIGERLISSEDLIILLDGLDEVAPERRKVCASAINNFCQSHLMPIAVCSRTNEYETLDTRLRLQGAVVLQPLSIENIDTYLNSLGPKLTSVRKILSNDALLRELARSPLMLGIITLAYRGLTIENLQHFDTKERRIAHIFDVYIDEMFKRRSSIQYYSPGQTIQRLSWLAAKMSSYGQLTFSIQQLQGSWLQTDGQMLLCVLIIGISIGAILGIISTLVGGGNFGLRMLLVLVGVIFGLIGGINSEWLKIGTYKEIFLIAAIGGLASGFIGGLTFGLMPGLIFSLTCLLLYWLLFGGLALIQNYVLRLILMKSGYLPWNYTRFLNYATERIFLRKVSGGYVFIHRLLMDHFAAMNEIEREQLA